MNSIITVDICLNGVTMSTDEYSLGHFSLSGRTTKVESGNSKVQYTYENDRNTGDGSMCSDR